MGRRPLGDLSTVPVTLPMAAMASNAGRAISPQQSGFLVMIGMGMSSRMIQGCNANRPVVSIAERTEGNSRLAPSAARVW